jgi:hypothetical protein
MGKVENTQVEFPKKIKVFRDMELADAMNRTLDTCRGTHFMKVDDDFILHPNALSHMLKCLSTPVNQNVAMYNWHLWEVWTSRIVSGIKIYSVEALKSIGGFTADKYAKFDKITHTRLVEASFELQKDRSVIGLHACGTWEEQSRYEKLWSKAAKFEYRKSTHIEQKQYNIPISDQVKLIDTGFLEQLNQKNNTRFYDWTGEKKCISLSKKKRAIGEKEKKKRTRSKSGTRIIRRRNRKSSFRNRRLGRKLY